MWLEYSWIFSGMFAGVVAVLATAAIEKFGGVRIGLGGIIATTPTTIIPASIGFALVKLKAGETILTSELTDMMFVVPSGMLINACVLLVWKYLPPRLPTRWHNVLKLSATITGSLLVWFLLASVMVWSHSRYITGEKSRVILVVEAVGCTFLIVLLGLALCWNPPKPSGERKPVKWYIYIARGILACICIMAAVFVGKINSFMAGVASIFPAIFLTTMVSLWISQGSSMQAGSIGPMLIGSSSVGAYAIVTCVAMVLTGNMFIGAAVGYVSSVLLFSVPTYFYIHWRQKVVYPAEEKTVGETDEIQLDVEEMSPDALLNDTPEQVQSPDEQIENYEEEEEEVEERGIQIH